MWSLPWQLHSDCCPILAVVLPYTLTYGPNYYSMERTQSVLSSSDESTPTDGDLEELVVTDSEGHSSEEEQPVVTAEGDGPYEKAVKYLEKHKIISLFQV